MIFSRQHLSARHVAALNIRVILYYESSGPPTARAYFVFFFHFFAPHPYVPVAVPRSFNYFFLLPSFLIRYYKHYVITLLAARARWHAPLFYEMMSERFFLFLSYKIQYGHCGRAPSPPTSRPPTPKLSLPICLYIYLIYVYLQ